MKIPLFKAIVSLLLVMFSFSFSMTTTAQQAGNVAQGQGSLAEEIQDIKKLTLELNRDLFILEEELLFPSNTQIAVFLSLDVGEFFALDAVKLSVDGVVVTNYLYTDRQLDALHRGGVQR